MADQNMVQNAVQPNGNQHNGEGDEWENQEDNVEGNEAAFEEINSQLDQLNSVLDCLEEKNDNIRAKLVELLHSNREARKQFQECRQEQGSTASDS